MQKIISVLAALVIFAFSIIGEDAKASLFCYKGNAPSSQITAAGNSISKISAISIENASRTPQGAEVFGHDCHFGHCGFTLIFLPSMATPTHSLTVKFISSLSSPQSGFSSETLRPPSLS